MHDYVRRQWSYTLQIRCKQKASWHTTIIPSDNTSSESSFEIVAILFLAVVECAIDMVVFISLTPIFLRLQNITEDVPV